MKAYQGSLFDRQLLLVSGKGGVGRTTVCACLALVAAQKGKKVLLAQMDAHDRLSSLLSTPDKPIGDAIVEVQPNIWAVNMTPAAALREYGRMNLPIAALYEMIFENRAVRSFLSAVPGLDAYSMLGKAWFHTTEKQGNHKRFDLVILDTPATGHVSTLLRIPRAILSAMPRGPLSKDARAIVALLTSPPDTLFVPITLAEELPVKEAKSLIETVDQDLHIAVGPLIVNAVPDAKWATSLADLRNAETPDSPVAASLAGLKVLAARRHAAEKALQGAADIETVPLVTLPHFIGGGLGPQEIAILAARLSHL